MSRGVALFSLNLINLLVTFSIQDCQVKQNGKGSHESEYCNHAYSINNFVANDLKKMLKTGQIQNFTLINKDSESHKTDSLIQYMAFKKATITGIKKEQSQNLFTIIDRNRKRQTIQL